MKFARETDRLSYLQRLGDLMARRDYQDHLERMRAAEPSDVRVEAEQGTVIDGVAVRKPQPRLT